ncbi:hypothetical protein C7H79_13805 [Nitrosomonas supralitoralis]|uniref:Uncharacterized protein n=1 Tax=Nitrosomonas supralitoralis TaxID=2116706 RepID=A0A2P7NSE5_9PROT|nr:hypothetical protein C7H79_13805 [Nitrosomonas supralitoralis]
MACSCKKEIEWLNAAIRKSLLFDYSISFPFGLEPHRLYSIVLRKIHLIHEYWKIYGSILIGTLFWNAEY